MADGITYGGQPIALDHEGIVADLLDTYWPGDRWPFRQRGATDGLSASTLLESRDQWLESPYPNEPAPGVNEMIIPTGAARYAKALILLGGEQMQAIATAIWGMAVVDLSGVLPDVWGTSQAFADLVFEANGSSNTWAMTPLTAIHIDGADARNLWLVPLVDRRYFLQRRLRGLSLPLDKTWAEMFALLGTAAGATITHPAIDADYLIPDADTFEGEGASVGQAIDAAALSVGLRAIPGSSGAAGITLQDAATAIAARDAFFAATTNELFGGITPRPPLPISLRLIAPRLVNHFPNVGGHDTTTVDFEATSASAERLSVYTSVWAQEFAGTLDSLSATQRTALAMQLATDLKAWAVDQHAATFPGVPSLAITGLDDFYSIGVRPDGSITGQIRSLPDDFWPWVQLSQSPAIFVHDHKSPLVKIVDTVSARSGTTLGNGLAVPMAVDRSTGTMVQQGKTDLSTVQIVVYNLGGTAIEPDEANPVYMQAHNANGLPVLGLAGKGVFVSFTLTADMTLQEATADVVQSYGETVTGSITISDPQNLFRFAKSGAKGWAFKHEGEFIAIECDQLAIQVLGTLVEYDPPTYDWGMKPSSPARIATGWAALTAPGFGQNPLGLDSLEIPNPLKLFGNVGDQVVLQFDQSTGSYFVLAVQRKATRVKGFASAAFTTAATSFTLNSLVGLDGAIADASITVQNVHEWDGASGDTVRAEWNVSGQVWEAYQKDC